MQGLIDKQDNVEIVRDQIAAILAQETVSQQALAVVADENPDLWKFKVFSERSRSLNSWVNQTSDKTPIVCVNLDSINYDLNRGNPISRQMCTATFNIDCCGLAVSTDAETGHVPGDYAAAIEAQRVARLVRNILMSGYYVHLGLTGIVSRRYIMSQQIITLDLGSPSALDVVAVRMRLEVQLIEEAAQYQGVPLQAVRVDFIREADGFVLAETDFTYA